MKKIFLVLFSLIMMFSVSFAIEPNVTYSRQRISSADGHSDCSVAGYDAEAIYNILQNYYSDSTNETYKTSYQDLLKAVENEGLNYLVYKPESQSSLYMITNDVATKAEFIYYDDYYIGMFYDNNTGSSVGLGHRYGYSKSCSMTYTINTGYDIAYMGNGISHIGEIYDCNADIYTIKNNYWDGITYKYEAPENTGSGGTESDFPELTDEELAELVERFINSNARLENMPHLYNEYFITYDTLSGYYRAYTYMSSVDLAIEYGNYDEEGNFITTGTEEGEAWQIRPYVFEGNIFERFNDWISYKRNEIAFRYFSISPDTTIEPRYIGTLEYNYCSNYKENEVVIYSSKQIRYVGEETNSEGKTETVVTDNYIPPTVLKDSVTGEEITIRDNFKDSSDSLENVITPNADFSGLKQAFEKYISFVNISSITWLTAAISSMITIFIPFVALGIIIFLINRILNGGS